MKFPTTKHGWLSQTTRTPVSTPVTVKEIIGETARRGGLVARWRVKRALDNASVKLSHDAVELLFNNQREELKHRAALELDRAKKRAIAESLADTTVIEKAIVEMTNHVFHELDEMVHANHTVIYANEANRLADMQAEVQAGRMLSTRLEDARARLEARVSDHLVRVEGMAERLIENLGERWQRTLNSSSQFDQ